MEINDFSHWNGNMKKFIDGAGEHMDAISVHLYDGINIRGKNLDVRVVIPKLF